MLSRGGLTIVQALNVQIWERWQPWLFSEQKLKRRRGDGGVVAHVVGEHKGQKKVFPVEGGVIHK